MLHFAGRKQPDSRHPVLIHYLRTVALPGSLVLLIPLAILGGLFFYQPSYLQQDLQGAAVRSDVGKVTSTTLLVGDPPVPAHVVDLNGQTVKVKADLPIRAGQQVLVKYRVGKSGVYYVDHIEAL